MAAGPQFNLDHEVTYGAVDQVSRLVQRVTCENPSKFTFTGTGTYIIGDERVAIIDPGPPEDAHVDALVAAIDGRTVTHLLITHTHGDHSPAAGLLKHHIDAPTYAFGPHPLDRPDPNAAKTEDDEAGFGFDPIEEDETEKDDKKDDEGYKSEHAHDWDFTPDVVVAHGDVIEGDGFNFEALHTPGHISNHLCFALQEEQALFSGDHVMGWSTTIIPPPDGNLNSYLDSLRLLMPRVRAHVLPHSRCTDHRPGGSGASTTASSRGQNRTDHFVHGRRHRHHQGDGAAHVHPCATPALPRGRSKRDEPSRGTARNQHRGLQRRQAKTSQSVLHDGVAPLYTGKSGEKAGRNEGRAGRGGGAAHHHHGKPCQTNVEM